MAEQTVVFAFSQGQIVKVIETGRDAWVDSLMIGSDTLAQYYIKTNKASGEPITYWAKAAEIEEIAPPAGGSNNATG